MHLVPCLLLTLVLPCARSCTATHAGPTHVRRMLVDSETNGRKLLAKCEGRICDSNSVSLHGLHGLHAPMCEACLRLSLEQQAQGSAPVLKHSSSPAQTSRPLSPGLLGHHCQRHAAFCTCMTAVLCRHDWHCNAGLRGAPVQEQLPRGSIPGRPAAAAAALGRHMGQDGVLLLVLCWLFTSHRAPRGVGCGLWGRT